MIGRRTFRVFAIFFIITFTTINFFPFHFCKNDGKFYFSTGSNPEYTPGATNESFDSVISRWDDVSADKKKFEPGAYQYEEYNIYLTGASITGDYHNRDALWFQLFALGDRPLFDKFRESKKTKNYYLCDFQKFPLPPSLNETSRITALKIQTRGELEKETFSCKIGSNRQAKLELIPDKGFDKNTNNIIQVWRCPLFGISGHDPLLSKMDATLFRKGLTDDGREMALGVEVLYGRGQNAKKLIEFNFPSMEPNIGLNKLTSTKTNMTQFLRDSFGQPSNVLPMLKQRFDFTLCTIAYSNGIVRLPEFIRYHLDILGVDHIHIGIHDPRNNLHLSETIGVANRLLQQDIDNEKVTLSAVSLSDSIGLKCPRTTVPEQTMFNQECLYRSKSTSEFVGFWDIDEYLLWMKDQNSSKDKNIKLADRLREIKREECEDWAFVTFESSIAGYKVHRPKTGMVALDFPEREKKTNRVWQKSISRTKNVFLSSIHLPGSILPTGSTSMADLQLVTPRDKNKCAFYINNTDAIMVHAVGVHRNKAKKLEDAIPNELVSKLGGGLVRQRSKH